MRSLRTCGGQLQPLPSPPPHTEPHSGQLEKVRGHKEDQLDGSNSPGGRGHAVPRSEPARLREPGAVPRVQLWQ